MKIKNFEEIESCKNARNLANDIYRVSSIKNFKNDFNLIDQIRRASISVMSKTYLPVGKVAEGFDSGTNKSFINFLNYSHRSASEVQSLLYVALDQEYISINEFELFYGKCKDIKNLIGGLIQYLSKSSAKN